MKKNLIAGAMALLALAGLGAAAAFEPPAGHVVDTGKLTDETQKDLPGKDSVGFVWWIPNEFWVASLAEEPEIPKQVTDELVGKLGEYTIVLVVDGEMNDEGEAKFVSQAELHRTLTLVDATGGVHRPLAAAEVNEQTREVFAQMKPMLEACAGEMGKGMHVFYFAGKGKDGGPLVDPRGDGFLQVRVGDRGVRYRLPLGALMPEKTCPTCGESQNGAWKFCPWDGAALKASAAAK